MPARLDSRSSSPSLQDLDQLADQDLDVAVGVVADAGGHRPQPADVAVVVGAEQVDAAVEAALAACRGSRRGRRRSRSARRWTGSAPGPCRRRSRWCAATARRRPRIGGPGRAASRAGRPTASLSCRSRSENQTSKWVLKASSWSCCSFELQRVRRPRGTRPARSSPVEVEDAGVVGDDRARRGRRCSRRGSRPRGPAARARPPRARRRTGPSGRRGR